MFRYSHFSIGNYVKSTRYYVKFLDSAKTDRRFGSCFFARHVLQSEKENTIKMQKSCIGKEKV